jgi:hypothetical protein
MRHVLVACHTPLALACGEGQREMASMLEAGGAR